MRAKVVGVLPSAVEGTKIVVGAVDAPHTVTVYADPRCPSCARFAAFSVLVDGEALDGGGGLYEAGEFGRLLDGALGP
ncbi:thioredoxin domain-containing protein [Streptomyces roseofulvus]|uniref:thioredoxin domain-containing protein n=1 Tax=Streptomyces roseofulvus TaxID=33902 RepID=UPI0031FC8075